MNTPFNARFSGLTRAALLSVLIVFAAIATAIAAPAQQADAPLPLSAVSVEGPSTSRVGEKFEVEAQIFPKEAAAPHTFEWHPEPMAGQGTMSATYVWADPGKQAIKVMVAGVDGGVISGERKIDILSAEALAAESATIAFSGDTRVAQGESMTVTLQIAPEAASDYTVVWTPFPDSGQGKPQATFSWATLGPKTINAWLINGDNSNVTASATVLVGAEALFLPLVAADDSPHTPQPSYDVDIIGGQEADPGAWPWKTALMTSPSYGPSHFCGGALIAPDWVLTAAHCVDFWGSGTLYAVVGRHRLTDSDGDARTVAEIVIHPNYNGWTSDSDIALLRLESPSTYTPVPLNAPTFSPGDSATVIGWGHTVAGDYTSASDVLMQVDVPIVSDAECDNAYPGEITDTMLCAGRAGRDSCQGDSGGPIMIPSDGGWAQIGIVSWGIGCALEGYPGVYTDVSVFGAWIQDTIETVVAGDAFEPDNSLAEAGSIATDGTLQSHTFHVSGDEDWVQFMATTGTTYTIETLNLGSETDTVVYLYNRDGNLLTFDDDGGPGRASLVQWTGDADDIVYVKVRDYYSLGGPEFSYDLRVTEAGGEVGDAFEPDNTIDQAGAITVGGPAQSRTFHVPGDEDWIAVNTSAGIVYVVETSNLAGQSDTYISLHDVDGKQIARDDDGGSGYASQITWMASGSTYYIRARDYDGSIGAPEIGYDIAVSQTAASGQDGYEPDNLQAEATMIEVDGLAQSHTFHVPGDVDWIRFDVTSSDAYIVETFNLAAGSDTYITLVDSSGNVVGRDDDGGAGFASRLALVASPGTYYVRVRHYAGIASGPGTHYEIGVTTQPVSPIDPWEPDDDMAQASPIGADGVLQSHTATFADDEDWVTFDATAGDTYLIATSHLAFKADTYITLLDATGGWLDGDDDSGAGYASSIKWVAGYTGAHHVAIRHYFPSASGANTRYSVGVTRFGGAGDTFELDDNRDQATLIDVDGLSQAHDFNVPRDQDWIYFDASAGTNYVIETFNLGGGSDTVVHLVDDSGNGLVENDDGGGAGLASRIVWQATYSGPHYVRVHHFDPGAGGADTAYEIAITAAAGESAVANGG